MCWGRNEFMLAMSRFWAYRVISCRLCSYVILMLLTDRHHPFDFASDITGYVTVTSTFVINTVRPLVQSFK